LRRAREPQASTFGSIGVPLSGILSGFFSPDENSWRYGIRLPITRFSAFRRCSLGRSAHAETPGDALRRHVARGAVVPVAVRLQERVRLLRRQVAEKAVHPDARRQDAERKFPFPDQLRRTAFVEVLEQVPRADLVEGNHSEIAPAVLENRRRRFHGLMGFPDVPWAVPARARALEHEDAGVPRLGPFVDALTRLPNLFRDFVEHVLVSGRHLDHLSIPDAPHRDGKAGMVRGDFHERVVVLGPKRDLPEAHGQPHRRRGGYRWCRHTTAAEGGSKRFVMDVFYSSEVQHMYLIAPDSTRIWTDSNRNFTLREYSRLEYGRSDIGWILASVKASRPAPTKRPKGSLGLRLRYFLNSFRGFAAFDVHGHDDTQCP